MGNDELRVVVVDNEEIVRRGLRDLLGDIDDVTVVDAYDFEDALARPSWQDVDWVIVDVAREDAEDEQTPAVPVIEAIRASSGSTEPMVVAITSNPVAYSEPLILRRLVDADPNVGLIWRHDLELHIKDAANARALDGEFKRVPTPTRPDEIPELGIDGDTKVSRLVEGAREIAGAASDRRNERQILLTRFEVARESGVSAVTEDGNMPRNTSIPSVRQYQRINRRASVPRDPRTRADPESDTGNA